MSLYFSWYLQIFRMNNVKARRNEHVKIFLTFILYHSHIYKLRVSGKHITSMQLEFAMQHKRQFHSRLTMLRFSEQLYFENFSNCNSFIMHRVIANPLKEHYDRPETFDKGCALHAAQNICLIIFL